GSQVGVIGSETFADLFPCQYGLGVRRRDVNEKTATRPPQKAWHASLLKSLFGCLEKLERSGEGSRRRTAGAGREEAVQAVWMEGQGQREQAQSDCQRQYGVDLGRLQYLQEPDQNRQHFSAGVLSAPGRMSGCVCRGLRVEQRQPHGIVTSGDAGKERNQGQGQS